MHMFTEDRNKNSHRPSLDVTQMPINKRMDGLWSMLSLLSNENTQHGTPQTMLMEEDISKKAYRV